MVLDGKKRIKGRNLRTVVITRGRDAGILAANTDNPNPMVMQPDTGKLPAPLMDEAGAGDAFVGGYLAAYIQGCNMEKCLRVGKALAGLSCTLKCTTLPAQINLTYKLADM